MTDVHAKTGAVTSHHGTDLRAALTGLVIGAIALLAIVYGVARLTNASFAGHDGAAAHAPAQGHAPAAPHPPDGASPAAAPAGGTTSPPAHPPPGTPPR